MLSSPGKSPSHRILQAVDNGDYPTALCLWDSLILSKPTKDMKKLLYIETLFNLYLATYAFRIETVTSAGSASMAASVASRTMTIFRNYVETRKDIMMRYNIATFIKINNIHRIAFPPTHPKYKDLFTEEWRTKTRKQIQLYLSKRLDNTNSLEDMQTNSPQSSLPPI